MNGSIALALIVESIKWLRKIGHILRVHVISGIINRDISVGILDVNRDSDGC